MSSPFLRNGLRIAFALILFAPLAWVLSDESRGEASGKPAIYQDAPEQASVPLTYGAAGYRYRVLQTGDAIPAGFEQPGFNDSSFDLGAAAFGAVAANSCAPPTTIRSVWPANTRLILRKKFTLPAGASNARLFVSVDNDIEKMWINGTQIETNRQNNNCAELDQFVYNLAPAQLVAGENTLAWQLLDRGGPTHFDARVVVTIPDPTPGTCVAPPSGLVSWFRGEDNANDTISRHNGYTTNVTYAPGRVGRAFSFDGVGDVTIPTNANTVSNQFTLDAWVFPTLYDGVYNRVITRNGSYEISIRDGDFNYYIRGVSGLPVTDGNGRTFGGGSVPLNQWTHLALTYDGSRARSFINGTLAREITGVSGNVTDALDAFVIGSQNGLTGTEKFDGLIDEVDYYNRALSVAEISSIVTASSAGKCTPTPFPAPTCVTPPSNFISWWKGEGNATDVQGGNLGYVSNNVTYAPGKVGQAFSFDGTGDVTIPTNTNLVTNTFTVGGWVYPTLYDGVYNRVITRNGSYEISIRDGDFNYYIRGVSGLPVTDGNGRTFGGGPVPLNQWTHLALTYDGSRVRSFINGRIARTITGVSGNVTDALDAFVIGSQNGLTGTDKFDGLIDEVMYFERALTETELTAIVNADSVGICPPPFAPPPSCVGPAANLVSWYKGENNPNDNIGSNNGAVSSGVTYAAGRVGQAFNFDGTGAVTVSSSSGLVSNQFTLDAWVFPTLYDGVYNRVITRNGSYEISIRDGDFNYYIRGVSGLPVTDGNGRTFGGGPVRLNQWTHLALTYDGNRVRSFVNGRIARTITGVTGNVTTNTSPFIIGSDAGLTGTDKFDGRIDEVDFFSRALADTEIMAIYQADSAGKCGGVNAPPLPSLTMTGVSLPEGNSGTSNANLTARLSSPSILPVTVSYTTADVTARAGSDYTATNGTLVFAPGETSKNITVQVVGDNVFEPHETFSVNLFSAFNAAIASGMGAATILNDDFATVGVLGFEANNFTANEGDNFATITLTRNGELGGTSTVDVATQDNLVFVDCAAANGTASQRCDYTTTVTTVTFAPDETSKSFVIPIINDAYPEGNETLSLSLGNATGTHIGPTTGATLTIVDNDSGPPNSNPIDAAQFFVRLNYYDFLNRLPDQAGLDYWTGQITMCGNDIACINSRRIGVSAAFFIELEFQESGAYVYRLYKAAFGEQTLYRPSYAQFLPDRARVVGGATLDEGKLDFANQFVSRADFLARYPASQTPTQFVDAILATVQQGAGLTFTPAQRADFISDVDTIGRGQMMKNLADNLAFRNAVFNRAFVLMQYFGYLRRDPDQGGYDFWLGVINQQPNNFRGMVCAFVTSGEYQQRFSSVVTRGNDLCNGMP